MSKAKPSSAKLRRATPMPTSPTRHRLPDLRRTRIVAAALAVSCAALLAAAPAPADPAAKPRVTIVGDSIMGSFDYISSARRVLGRGLDLRADNAVCRRLVTASCPFQGSTPATALDVIRSRGHMLGKVVVINVGYNEWSAVYDVDRVMRALTAAGVSRVIWVTLREAGGYAAVYAGSNSRIRAAKRKWKSLVVADWDQHSRGQSWFGPDGLHLTPAGAMGLARLLRPLVVAGTSST
jgi:hypothetical protein